MLRPLLCVFVVGLCAAPAPSAAQSTVFVMLTGSCQGGATPCDPPRILQADAEQGRVVAVFPIACAGTALRNTADGRFLVWNEWCNAVFGQLRGLDLTTGAQFALGPAPRSLESHPSELRLLFPEAQTIVSLTPAGRTVVPATGCPDGPFTLSGNGARLVQTCPSGYVVRTVATGAVVRTISSTPEDVASPVLDEQGTAAYILRMNAINFRTQQLVRVDVATGAESAPRTSLGDTIEGYGRQRLDRRTGRVVIGTSGLVEPFDPVTLAPAPTFRAGGVSSGPPVFHPVLSRAYGWSGPLVDAVDPDRRVTLGQALVGASGDSIADIAVAPHPPAPAGLTATVVGRQVTLTWSAGARSPLLTGYDLEVGSAPGASDLVRVPVTATSFAAAGVPSGAYYVRVRARNYAGQSAASNEILVTVP
jgi:hypothetical protein